MSKKTKIKNSQRYNYLLLTAEIITITLVISAFVAPKLIEFLSPRPLSWQPSARLAKQGSLKAEIS